MGVDTVYTMCVYVDYTSEYATVVGQHLVLCKIVFLSWAMQIEITSVSCWVSCHVCSSILAALA